MTPVGDWGPTLKAAYPKALATLIRVLGNIDTAEDALQDAIARALKAWPDSGAPDNAVAWLVTTGRRCAIDRFRRQAREARHVAALLALAETDVQPAGDAPADRHLEDDLLRLVFTCCHPALAADVQVALTLRTIAGLTVAEIARAFLVQPKTMEQRLTRAKRKIQAARIPYEVPAAAALPERLDAVLSVAYLIFNEGYSASGGAELIRHDLCREAIRLARLLARLFRGEPEVTGLLALLLLQHSRAAARLDGAGNIIVLDTQDRRLWDRALIAEGQALVEQALRRHQPGPYQIQAAIAAVHSQATAADATDWPQIAALYVLLEQHQPSPVVTLNRAVAVARAAGPAAGLAVLETCAAVPEMQRYHHFHAAQAALLAETGAAAPAQAAYRRALALTENPSEQAFLRAKIAALTAP